MTVVYVDSVFVLNTLMDYLILLATAGFAGISPHRFRCFLSAVLGGAYAVAVFLPGCGFLADWPYKIVVGVLLAAVAFAGRKHFIRLTFMLFAVSCGMAGCVLALGFLAGNVPMENGIFYTNIDVKVLLIAAGAAYLLLTVVFHASARHHICGTLVPVTISFQGRQASLTALCDTGNALLDPATGRPVLVASASCLAEIWPPNIRKYLTGHSLRDPTGTMERISGMGVAIRFHLIPYNAVGVAGGLLLAFRSDWSEIGGHRYQKLLVALSPTEVGETFSALWGEAEGGKGNAKTVGMAETIPAKAGTHTQTADPLHRRK